MLIYELFIKKKKVTGSKSARVNWMLLSKWQQSNRALLHVTSVLVLAINNLRLTSKNEY